MEKQRDSENSLNLSASTKNLIDVLMCLSEEQQRTGILQIFKPLLPEAIKTAEDFSAVSFIFPGQQRVFFEVLEGYLPALIKTTKDFMSIMRTCSGQKTEIFDKLKTKLPGLINTANDFAEVLYSLGYTQCEVIFELMKMRLDDLIKTPGDVSRILCSVDKNLLNITCESIKEQLQKISDADSNNFNLICRDLVPAKKVFLEKFMNRLLPLEEQRHSFFAKNNASKEKIESATNENEMTENKPNLQL